jgi:hypothetical protein
MGRATLAGSEALAAAGWGTDLRVRAELGGDGFLRQPRFDCLPLGVEEY